MVRCDKDILQTVLPPFPGAFSGWEESPDNTERRTT